MNATGVTRDLPDLLVSANITRFTLGSMTTTVKAVAKDLHALQTIMCI